MAFQVTSDCQGLACSSAVPPQELLGRVLVRKLSDADGDHVLIKCAHSCNHSVACKPVITDAVRRLIADNTQRPFADVLRLVRANHTDANLVTNARLKYVCALARYGCVKFAKARSVEELLRHLRSDSGCLRSFGAVMVSNSVTETRGYLAVTTTLGERLLQSDKAVRVTSTLFIDGTFKANVDG
ncbi:hypothetical protein BCR44DRAFT_1136280 [Catenaria anguillulae PL171]|uniref:Uncharacterized protein n=1 Tax=Catenaria anguillulae PL171 TaxID=765915 RepID=A0A1Y2HJU1_9FUNG|nr:hypothetical protein BCR44DRAFT_1136280 [Catenaria anguillulae PL171]